MFNKDKSPMSAKNQKKSPISSRDVKEVESEQIQETARAYDLAFGTTQRRDANFSFVSKSPTPKKKSGGTGRKKSADDKK